MRKKGWLGIAGALAAIALVLFLVPIWAPPARGPSPSAPAERQRAAAETGYKELAVRQNMAATDLLNRLQSARDARMFAKGTKSGGPTLHARLRAYLSEHPETVAATSVGGGSGKGDVTAGTLSPALEQASRAQRSRARDAVRKGVSYLSPSFAHDGKSYYVVGEPSASRGGRGLVALVSASVVQEVERHQRRNLRLVPYPAEGRYRIESVLPNTTKDVTVRSGEDNGDVSHYSVDEVVVKFRRPLQPKELLGLRKELDLTVVRHTRQTYVFRSRKHRAEELMAYFKKRWNPVYAEPHYLYLTNELDSDKADIVPNDTLYSQYQWNLPEIATEQGWKWSKGSEKVVVAVVDTGVQSDHPDLKGRLVKGINLVDRSKPPEDDVGHGTHVAGIIAAEVNNGEGVAGLTWYTKIMPVKALDSSGAGSTYTVAEGIIWAADHGADVINMSLGNYAQAEFLHDAIKYAHDKGVILIAASGNDNTARPGFPAAYPEVFAVAATDPGGIKAEYSNFGDYIDVAAPGTSIASTYPGSRYAALSGTSMACPHVSALAALVRAASPNMPGDDVLELLRKTAKDLGAKGKDDQFGYGEIDIRNALLTAGGQSASLQMFPEQVRRKLQSLLNR